MTEVSASPGVLVVGAGVSGLTTAVCLAEAGRQVLVRAAEPPRRTTSMIAGAMWGPSFLEPMARTSVWTRRSLQDFRELADDPASGVRMAPSLVVGDLPPATDLPPQLAVVPDLRPCPTDELPPGFRAGARGTAPLVDMPRYLTYLESRLAAAGGQIEIRRLRSLAEALDVAPVVVNCTGLGARDLVDDRTTRPVRGQHVVVRNPGLDELFMELGPGPERTSFFPHRDRVVCGGSFVPDSWDTTVDPALTERILARCSRVEPRLAEAEVLDVVVGLRPDRPAVRVEAEQLDGGLIVHNYGHGGSGVSLSWGCAREAAALALSRPGRAATAGSG